MGALYCHLVRHIAIKKKVIGWFRVCVCVFHLFEVSFGLVWLVLKAVKGVGSNCIRGLIRPFRAL